MSSWREKAIHFLENERPFRLGSLVTESPHPKTARLSQTIEQDTARGIRLLLEVDEDMRPAAARALASEAFGRLVEAIRRAVLHGNRVFFTGCGATGRLSILLEAAWRRFWQEARQRDASLGSPADEFENSVYSIMAGGDYALVRSVEGFEDFPEFGGRQLVEGGVRAGDVVVAITEGGETSFVIGTAWKGVDTGAEVFFVYNNPTDVLRTQVERSRRVLDDERIVKLDLSSGPMAIAGSTRMQATSIELLIVGAALETALCGVLAERLHTPGTGSFFGPDCVDHSICVTAEKGACPPLAGDKAMVPRERLPASRPPDQYATMLAELLAQLASPAAVAAMAAMVEFEEDIYRRQGLVTYLADEFLLDVLTDTTERSPTFHCPPFRKCDDQVSARPWAFVKNPLFATVDAWGQVFRRAPRGLDWTEATYQELDAPDVLKARPPKLDNAEILKFQIGNEADRSRFESPTSAVVAVLVGRETSTNPSPPNPSRANPSRDRKGAVQIATHRPEAILRQMAPFHQRAVLSIGPDPVELGDARAFHVPCRPADSPLRLWERLAVKMVLNTVSTATMARLGRVVGNRMVHVATSNKKLIDRGIRLVAELTGLSYEDSCLALFETMAEVESLPPRAGYAPSPVALTIERLGNTKTEPPRTEPRP